MNVAGHGVLVFYCIAPPSFSTSSTAQFIVAARFALDDSVPVNEALALVAEIGGKVEKARVWLPNVPDVTPGFGTPLIGRLRRAGVLGPGVGDVVKYEFTIRNARVSVYQLRASLVTRDFVDISTEWIRIAFLDTGPGYRQRVQGTTEAERR